MAVKVLCKVFARTLKDLKKMDKHTAALILGRVRKNLEGRENLCLHGKGLTADRGQWRYRIEDYRLLAHIEDNTVTILILTAGHRRKVYK